MLGEIMVTKGVVGAIVDGAIRDAETLAAQGVVIFARSGLIRSAADSLPCRPRTWPNRSSTLTTLLRSLPPR
jgi:Aldolase/RraA